jgi:hypothetical protein
MTRSTILQISALTEGASVTIRPRRGGYQVIVYAGIDPVTGRQRQIARQVLAALDCMSGSAVEAVNSCSIVVRT